MRIGMIGLGAMGLPIAKRLLGAGHELCAFDLSPRAAGEAEAAGARICPTAGEAAADTEVLFCSLPNAAIVRSVLEEILGRESIGASVIADLSSIAPNRRGNFPRWPRRVGSPTWTAR